MVSDGGVSIAATGDGRRFLLTQLTNAVAAGVSSVALPWLVLDITGSAAAAGLIFAVGLLPYLLLGLVVGVIADRCQPRSVLGFALLGQALFAAIVPIWALVGQPPLLLIGVSAFAVGAGRVFVDAAAFPMIAALAGPSRFTRSQAVVGAMQSSGLLIGPAVGGGLVGVVGPSRALAAEAVSFAIAAALAAGISTRSARQPDRPMPLRRRLVSGLRFVAGHVYVRRLMTVGAVATFTTGGLTGLMVPILRHGAGLSGVDAGTVLALTAISGIAGAAAVGKLLDHYRPEGLLSFCLGGSGLSTMALSWSNGLVQAAAALIVYGFLASVIAAVYTGERQKRVPSEMQALVGISSRTLMMGCSLLGAVAAAALAAVMPLTAVIMALGGATVIVGVLSQWKLAAWQTSGGGQVASADEGAESSV
jgi:MFS family permease